MIPNIRKSILHLPLEVVTVPLNISSGRCKKTTVDIAMWKTLVDKVDHFK